MHPLPAWLPLALMVLAGGCALSHSRAGDAPDAGREVDADVTRESGEGSRAIAAGAHHVCARVGDTVRCWGENIHGQLGNGTTTDSATAVVVTGLIDVAEITAGSEHTCARLVDRTVRCWGDNRFGELGDGSLTDARTPVTVTGLSEVVEVTAADHHTCARMPDLTVRCWGRNVSGQLGLGDTIDRSTPQEVMGVAGAVAISAGGNIMEVGHTCAVLVDGSARCWGQNFSGQLGSGGTMPISPDPVVVSGLANVVEIAAGDLQTCARLSDGTARCWGENTFGQLGTGDTTSSSTPVAVVGLAGVVELTAGNAHVCAVLTDGTVRCWGINGGRLGDGGTATSSTTPVPVVGLADVAEISAGPGHTCARLTDGTIRCWGDGTYGQLGNGATMTTSSVPVAVLGIP